MMHSKAKRTREKPPSETSRPVELHVEDGISSQWAETHPPLFGVIVLVASIWSVLRGRERPHPDPALLRRDSSDEDFRAFAAEALSRDRSAQFGSVLSQ